MIRKIAGLLRITARDLEELSDSTPGDSDQKGSEEHPAASTQAELAPPQDDKTPPPSLWKRLASAERDRLGWLLSHPHVIGIALGLAIVIVITEKWLIRAWGWLTSQARLYWPDLANHPVALAAVGLVLIYLIFGLQWLRYVDDLIRWVWGSTKRRPHLSALFWGIILLIVLWIANNYGTWVVLPFTVGHIETVSLNGETVAAQLIAELNQVGVGNPTPVLILWELQEPRTSSGRVTASRSLPLEECDVVLRGPGDFIATRRIPLPRVVTGSQGSRLDLGNLSIGTINIPSQIVTQFLLKMLPTGYREFSGQINENRGQLEISVSSRNPSYAWRVAGPSDTFPEMLEYLALRIALDLNPELIKSSGLDAAPSDRDLAFAMGNQAFRQQRYQRAQAFYQLADDFAALDEKVDAMLGLSHYHLALAQLGEDPSRLDAALQKMEAAVREDPNGDSSLLRPYLACLYHKVGTQDQAETQRLVFTQYLRRLEFQDFEVRVDALKQLPLRGPGRHLSAVGSDVIFVDEVGTVMGAGGRPLEANLSLPNQNPRQIGLYGDSNLLLISSDGAALTGDYRMPEETQAAPTVLIEGRALSGIQQFGASTSQFRRTNLFLLNREGEIFWCEPNAEAGSTSACPPRQAIDSPSARQIFPIEDQLYILAADGAVWRAEVNLSGRTSKPQSMTSSAPVQEIFVARDGTLFLLHDNGSVWRYYDDSRPETEDLKLIDPGTGTAQIFAAGSYLYLLKSDGAVWRISNPRNPTPGNDLTEIWTPPPEITIQEMFVTTSTKDEDPSGSRVLYLLTQQRVLLQGTDADDTRVAFTPVSMPTPVQKEVSK
jgi:tetratricopeptide (TPR) repeat protein